MPEDKLILGFTGTGDALALLPPRYVALEEALKYWHNHGYAEFHHGDCIGADAIAHEYADKIGYRITIHPPEISTKRAFCTGRDVYVRGTRPYLKRNRNIAYACTLLLAMPKRIGHEELRSGTWSTVRYARKMGKEVRFI